MNQSLTVNLPSEIYVRIQKRAEEAHRSVEEQAVELLAASVPDEFDLSETALALLDNAAVERAARSGLAAELARELETLHLKQQREGLTELESARCIELVRAYERSMLLRAHAVALLKTRGIDVSHPVVQP